MKQVSHPFSLSKLIEFCKYCLQPINHHKKPNRVKTHLSKCGEYLRNRKSEELTAEDETSRITFDEETVKEIEGLIVLHYFKIRLFNISKKRKLVK